MPTEAKQTDLHLPQKYTLINKGGVDNVEDKV